MKIKIEVEYIIKESELQILEDLKLNSDSDILEFFNNQLDMSSLDSALTKGVAISFER